MKPQNFAAKNERIRADFIALKKNNPNRLPPLLPPVLASAAKVISSPAVPSCKSLASNLSGGKCKSASA